MLSITDFLGQKPPEVLILDGGLGTELEGLGCDLKDPLWSGKTLLEDPESIQKVEVSYLKAGARCLITASYQVTPESYLLHRGLPLEEGSALIRRSVELAKAAREEYWSALQPDARPPIYIAGCVGPYGAFLADGSEYNGTYKDAVTESALKAFHLPRLKALMEAEVDIIAVETQAVRKEVLVIVDLIESLYPQCPLWVSFTTSAEDISKLPDGTPLGDIVAELDSHPSIVAVGTNCVSLQQARKILEIIATKTTKPLVVYPNSGEEYNTQTKAWSTPSSRDPHEHTLAKQAKDWISLGAQLVGGCCRTTPADISELVKATQPH